jgi:hypothetical protein
VTLILLSFTIDHIEAHAISLTNGSLINEIDDLNDDVFHEHLIEEILPDRQSMFPLGLHTRNMGTDAIVIDGLRNIPARSRQH